MTMTRLLSVFIVLLLVASASFSAAKRGADQQSRVAEAPLKQFVDNSVDLSIPPSEVPLYVRPQYNSESLVPILPGTYTIGTGGTHATLAAAVAHLQANGVAGGGTVFFHFIDTSYTSAGVTIGGYPGQGVAAPVVFRPAPSVTPHIFFTGVASESTYAIRLSNARGVTFDGSNSGGTDRSLTIECDTAMTITRFGVVIQAGSQNVTLRNMVLRGFRKAAGQSGTLIIIDSVGNTANGGNLNINIENNHLRRGFNGIFERGRSDAIRNVGLYIRKNLIGGGSNPNTVEHLAGTGINLIQFTTTIRIEENDINGIKVASGVIFGFAIRGSQIDVEVTKNKIRNIVVTGGLGNFAPIGFLIGNIVSTPTTAKTEATIINNMFYDFHNFADVSLNPGFGRKIRGIVYNPTSAPNSANGVGSFVVFVNNTIHFDLAAVETTGTSFVFDMNFFGSNTTAGMGDEILYHNNILSSRRAGGLESRQFLAFGAGHATTFDFQSNYNLFHTVGNTFFCQIPDPWPMGGSALVGTFAEYKTLSGQDGFSEEGDPLFVSSTIAHISTAPGDLSPADSLAIPYPGAVDFDIDGQPRDLNRPDAGADEFTVVYATLDGQSTALVLPTNGTIYTNGTAVAPQASFRNNGSLPTSIPARYEIRNALGGLVYSHVTATSSLGSGASQTLTFTTTPSLSPGKYTIRAISMLAGDVIPANDTLSGTVWVLGVISSFPYTEDFEGPAPEMAGGFGWATGTISGTVNDWVIGTPAKTQISSAFNGVKAWVTKTTGDYSAGQRSFVHSPVLNLSSASGDIRLEWWQNFEIEDNWDGGVLEMSVNGGASWARVDSTLGSGPTFNTANSIGWYNTPLDSSSLLLPPMWSETTYDYSGNINGWTKASTRITGISGQADVRFRWRFSVDAFVQEEGWAIDNVTVLEDAATVNVATSTGWDVLSNPVITPNNGVQQLYPQSAFNYGFGFNTATGYVQQSNMTNGRGYWVKLNSGGTVSVGGGVLLSVLAPVTTGWNMVGSVGFDVDTADVVKIPSGIVITSYFGYSGGYTPAATLVSGRGYWVKVGANGALLIKSTGPAPAPRQFVSPYDNLSSIVITDNNGNAQTLYFGADEALVNAGEMPPLPPEGAFDARFVSGNAGYMVRTHDARSTQMDMPIVVQSIAYPLTISWTIAGEAGLEGRTYMLLDEFGNPLSQMGRSGSIQIENASQKRFGIGVSGGIDIPVEFALSQNYPNPFNPSTSIRFALPTESRVTVGIYNLLGQLVSALVNDVREAGYHAIEWNGTGSTGKQLGSGVYFVKFHADGGQGQTFSDVRKIMMMK